jgi:hypothetical protein
MLMMVLRRTPLVYLSVTLEFISYRYLTITVGSDGHGR